MSVPNDCRLDNPSGLERLTLRVQQLKAQGLQLGAARSELLREALAAGQVPPTEAIIQATAAVYASPRAASKRAPPDVLQVEQDQVAQTQVPAPRATTVPNAPADNGVGESENVTQDLQDLQRVSASLSELQRGGPSPPLCSPDSDPEKAPRRNTKPRPGETTYQDEKAQRVPSSLSLDDYLACVVRELKRELEPENEWQRLFLFIRLSKAHPSLGKITAEKAAQAIDKVFRAWQAQYQDAANTICEKCLGGTQEDLHVAILQAWDKVRYLPGYSPLTNALERTRRTPLKLSREHAPKFTAVYERFVSIAGWLQVAMGDRPIFLPVHELSVLLHVQPMTITRYRQWAIEDGLLRLAPGGESKYNGPGRKGRATEFRFNVGRFPILSDTAEDGTDQSYDAAQ